MLIHVVGICWHVLIVVTLAYGTLIGLLVEDELLQLVHLLLLGLLIQVAKHELLLLLLLLFPLILLFESRSLLQRLRRLGLRGYLLTLTGFPGRLRFGLGPKVLYIKLYCLSLVLALSYKFVLNLLVLSHPPQLLFVLLSHSHT